MRITIAILGLAAVIAVPVIAQQAPSLPGIHNTKQILSGTYQVEGDHSQAVFTVNHFGFSDYSAQFIQPSGTLALDPANPTGAKVEIVFPIDKVSTTASALDAHLKTPDFFDAAKYPEARFSSTTVTVKGSTAIIAGNLTLKGVTKPVVLNARFIGTGINPLTKKNTIGFAATTSIKRSDFGVSYGIPLVSDKVDLAFNMAFEQ